MVFQKEMWRHDYALKHTEIFDRTTETHELISRQDAVRNDYINWLSRESGVDRRIGRSTKLANGVVAGWAFHMPTGRKRRQTERTSFDMLAPHLRQMFRLSALLGEAKARGDALESVMDARADAIILLDFGGRIQFANSAARQLSAAHDGLDCAGERPCFSHGRDRQAFAALYARALQAVASGGAGAIGQMLAVRPSGRRAYVIELAPASQETRQSVHNRCAFIMTIHDPARQGGGRIELWRTLFGLTATEARVALLSMRGMDDATIAARYGIGVGTVRSHQRHILAKTETRSKAELAYLLTRLE